MSALQQMREQLERELTRATTRRQERLIGQALVELSERIEFREFAELNDGSVRPPPGFTLASPLLAPRPPHLQHVPPVPPLSRSST